MLPGLINNDLKCILGIWLLLETGHEEMTQVPRCIICQMVQSTRELTFKKGKLLANLSHQQHAKIIKILSNKIQQGIQITIYHGQVEFTPGIHVNLT